MKKTATLFLALVLILSSVSMFAFSASAADAIDSSLIIHYDFEGQTIEEALKDKATAGNAADNLEAYPYGNQYTEGVFTGMSVAPGSTEFYEAFTWDRANGTMTNVEGISSLQAVNSADTRLVGANNTCHVIRFKVHANPNAKNVFLCGKQLAWNNLDYTLLIDKNNQLRTCVTKNEKVSNRNFATIATDVMGDKYFNIAINTAIVVNDDNTKSIIFTPYVSYNEATSVSDWTELAPVTVGYYENTATLEVACLSLFASSPGLEQCFSMTMDDFRLYNKTLKAEDLATISYKADGTADINPAPPVADTEPADTTPADTTPVDTTPADTTPADTTPTDTTPTDTTPVDTAADSAADTTGDTEQVKSGCGSVLGLSAFVIVLPMACGMMLKKRR